MVWQEKYPRSRGEWAPENRGDTIEHIVTEVITMLFALGMNYILPPIQTENVVARRLDQEQVEFQNQHGIGERNGEFISDE